MAFKLMAVAPPFGPPFALPSAPLREREGSAKGARREREGSAKGAKSEDMPAQRVGDLLRSLSGVEGNGVGRPHPHIVDCVVVVEPVTNS